MLFLITSYQGVYGSVGHAFLVGGRLPDVLASNFMAIRPGHARFLDFWSGSRVRGPAPEVPEDAIDILLIDADVWISRGALEQLEWNAHVRNAPVKVVLPAPAPGATGGPDVVALYIPAAVAASVLGAVGETALQRGVRAAGELVPDALLLDARQLDAEDPPLRVTGMADLAVLERRILLRRAFAALSAGVRIRDPHQVAIRGELHCGVDVEIDLNVIIDGRVTLGDGVAVGAHSILIDSTIGARTLIKPYSIVEQAQIGADNVVGPYGRIRAGTLTGDAVQIGNFVEIKNTEIGRGSRINHLSFIGDATVGSDVTLGAGTITCNHNRHGAVRTVIGDGAYVGSGTELVAPLIVGESATIGAGSTITDDVPAGTLALARQRQVLVPGWRPPHPTPPT